MADERELVGGLPRSVANIEPPRPSSFRVGGMTLRVLFDCGCVYERVLKGCMAKQGHRVIACFAHLKEHGEKAIAAQGSAELEKAGVRVV